MYVLHRNIPLPWHTVITKQHNSNIYNIKQIFQMYYKFFLTVQHIFPNRRYQILNPKDISGMEDPKKCSKILIESTALDPDLYRLGHTKAWFLFFF